MTTNLEWLYEHDESFAYGVRRFVVDDGYSWCETLDQAHEWLMSPYANDDFAPESVVTPETVDANDVDVAHDSREKLEADIMKESDSFIHTPWGFRRIRMWLDRQAAITHHEAFMRGRASLDDELAEYADEIAELASERDNLARDLAECDENRIELRDQRDRAEEMLAQMERERDYWKLHTDCWADKCKDAEAERDAYHERAVELEIELAQANGILKNTTHNHAAAKAKYERAQADAARARERQLEAERKYAELLEKPPEGAWAERIAVLEAGNRELREKLSEAIGHAHEIGKLGDLEGRAAS